MQRKTELWIVGGFVIVVVAVALLAYVFSGNATPASFNATQTAAITATDHQRGDSASKVSVIEYGDFECPACGQYESLMEQLASQYGARVNFVFRNFPLYQIHPFAMISAQAAEAAGLQGKYWEMHDLLYKNQSEWSTDTSLAPAKVVSQYFDTYATQLGLDVAKFDADINSDAVKNKVQHDLSLGTQASVDHTPTFFINLAQIPNPGSLAEFQSAIDAALASSTSPANSSQAAQ
jgi:protein-disulfide isomerase